MMLCHGEDSSTPVQGWGYRKAGALRQTADTTVIYFRTEIEPLKKSETSVPDHLSDEARSWWRRLTDEFELDDADGILLLGVAGFIWLWSGWGAYKARRRAENGYPLATPTGFSARVMGRPTTR